MNNVLDISLDLGSVQLTSPLSPVAEPRKFLTLIPDTTDEYLLIIDNTAAEKIMMCPTMAMYYLYYRREGHARNAALVFGGAVHEGLELLLHGAGEVRVQDGSWTRIANPNTDEEFTKRINNAITTFFTNNPAPPDEYRTVNNAIEVLRKYRERANLPDYEWSVLSDNRGLLIERAFELPLGVLGVDTNIRLPEWDTERFVSRIHVAWSGRIDLVAQTNGRNRIVDHKTTSIAGDNFTQDFLLANGTQGYVWAGQQLWPELDISGFCLNAIFLKKPAAGVSISSVGPRGGKPALDFFRAYYDYSSQRLSEWADNALTVVEDFVHCLVRQRFPMYTKQCFNKYGKCSYHDVCTIDDSETRVRILMSDAFKPVTWDPTTGR
jgi:hypothetical protein